MEAWRKSSGTFGVMSICSFVPGYFETTLTQRPEDETYALIVEDADLPSSVKTVLRFTWPRLRSGGNFFCHEARDREVVALFYAEDFWQQDLRCPPPGFVGSGLGLFPDREDSCLGWTVKR